jgi:hypothetical protein
MATFEVTSPDGKTYEVDAPEGATQADAIAYVKKKYYGGQPSTPKSKPEESTTRQKMQAAAQGATWALADEAVAAVGATYGKLIDGREESWGEIYSDIVDAERADLDDYRKSHPVEALGYEVGGGVVTGGMGAKTILSKVGTKTVPKIAAGSAVAGGMYGAGAGEGVEGRLKEGAIGAVAGGVIGGVGTKGYRVGKQVARNRRWRNKESRLKMADKFQQELYVKNLMGDNWLDAFNRTKAEFGLTHEDLVRLKKERGAPFKVAAKLEDAAQGLVDSKPWMHNQIAGKTRKFMADFYRDSYDRIGNWSPRLQQKLYNMEYDVIQKIHDKHDEFHDYIRLIRRTYFAQGKEKKLFTKALNNGDFDDAKALLVNRFRSNPQKQQWASDVFDDAMTKVQSLGQEMKAAGINMPEDLQHFYPRRIKDMTGLRTWLQKHGGQQVIDDYDARLAKYGDATDTRPKDLTAAEESTIMNDILRKHMKGTSKKATSAFGRKIAKLNDQMMEFYEDPVGSLDLFIREAVQHIERRKFFGPHLSKAAKTVDKEGFEHINTAVSKFTKELSDLKSKDPLAMEEVKAILNARFVGGERSASELVNKMRTAGYLTTITDYYNAITQLADIGIAMYRQGTYPVFESTMRLLTGKEFTKAKHLGLLREMATELTSPASIERFSHNMFRYSGFRFIDAVGKNLTLNAAFIKARRQLSTKAGKRAFIEKYGKSWGEDMPQLMNDLRNGQVTDVTKSFVFTELSGQQPITRGNMPMAFLNNPNGRIWYQLATWQMKQLNMFFQEIARDLAKGNAKAKAAATKDLLRAFVFIGGAGVGVEEIKRQITGRQSTLDDLETMPELMAQHALKNFVNTHFDYAINIPFVEHAGQSVEALKGGMTEKEWGRLVQKMPLIGQFTYYWGMGGAEEFNKKKEQERERAMKEAFKF